MLSPIQKKEERKEDPCLHGPLRRSSPIRKDHRYKAISLLGHLTLYGGASLGCSPLLASQDGASPLSRHTSFQDFFNRYIEKVCPAMISFSLHHAFLYHFTTALATSVSVSSCHVRGLFAWSHETALLIDRCSDKRSACFTFSAGQQCERRRMMQPQIGSRSGRPDCL